MGTPSQASDPGAVRPRPRQGTARAHRFSRLSTLAIADLLQGLGIGGAVVLAIYLPFAIGPAGWIGTILIGTLLVGMLLVWLAAEMVRSRQLWVAGIVTITMSLLVGAVALCVAFVGALSSAAG